MAHLPSIASLKVWKARTGFRLENIFLVSTTMFSRARGVRTLPGMHCDHVLRTFLMLLQLYWQRESNDRLEHRSVIQVALILFQIGIICSVLNFWDRRSFRFTRALLWLFSSNSHVDCSVFDLTILVWQASFRVYELTGHGARVLAFICFCFVLLFPWN